MSAVQLMLSCDAKTKQLVGEGEWLVLLLQALLLAAVETSRVGLH